MVPPPTSPTDDSESLDTIMSPDGAMLTSPGSVTTVSSSLFMNITRLSNEAYPATEAIKYLIDAVCHDVISFRRNAQVSYLLVDRAREICDAINAHIQRTESGEDWISFEKYTNAIDPMEEALFKLIAFTEDEKELYLGTGNSVEDCVAATEHWATNRDGIWGALGDLETKSELTGLFSAVDATSRQADMFEARRHDDNTFFEDIIGDIKDALKGFKRLPTAIRNVDANLDRLFTKMTSDSILPWLTVFTVKTGLLVQGIVNLSLRPAPIDTATRNHLRSRSVWEAAEELAELLNSTTGDDKASIDRVRLKYEAFIRTLRNTTELPTPKSYIELMKQAGRVRRPFQAQAVALILLCRLLVAEFAQEHHHTADNSLLLEDTCDETLKALKQVVAAVTELKMFDFDTTNFEDHTAYKALVVAQNQIRACFNGFGLGGSWGEKEQLIMDAVRKDRERMEELNKRLVTRPPFTMQERAAQVKVIVAVYYETEEGREFVCDVALETESSARLRSVRWTVAAGLGEELARPTRQLGEFLLPQDDERCELHRSISEFTNSGNECALRLVVRV